MGQEKFLTLSFSVLRINSCRISLQQTLSSPFWVLTCLQVFIKVQKC